MITSAYYVQQVQESMVSKGSSVSEAIWRPIFKGVQNTSNLPKFHFDQQSSNVPSGIPSHKGEKGPKIPKRMNLGSTGIRRSALLDNKPRQKYDLFNKFSLAVIGACEVDNNPHIFLTGENQHIKEINRNVYGTLNHYGTMVFS